jgi:hypothetical protein
MTEQWIIVKHWGDFQHYKDRDPTWIKNYTRLLHDDAYLDLTLHQRGVLHGIWLSYAAADGQLRGSMATGGRQGRDSTARLSRQLGERVTTATLEALNHAGFIGFSASKPPRLSASLEKLREEKEKKDLKAPPRQTPNPNSKPNGREEERPLIDVVEACGRFIQGQAWDETFDEEAMVEEFQRIERGRRTQGTLGPEVQDLIEEWKNVRHERYGEPSIT